MGIHGSPHVSQRLSQEQQPAQRCPGRCSAPALWHGCCPPPAHWGPDDVTQWRRRWLSLGRRPGRPSEPSPQPWGESELSGGPRLAENHRHFQPFARGCAGGAPLSAPPAAPTPKPFSSRCQQAQTLPHPCRGAGSPPGVGRHPPPPTSLPQASPRRGSQEHGHGFPCPAAVPEMPLSPARLHVSPVPGSRGCPPLPSCWGCRNEGPKHHTQLPGTDRQTDVGRLQPFLLLQHGRT